MLLAEGLSSRFPRLSRLCYRGNDGVSYFLAIMADTAITEDPKFYSLGRDLANTEKSVRDKAVATIRR